MKRLLVASVLSLMLVGTAVGQAPFGVAPGGGPTLIYGGIHGNPGLVVELQINFTLHDLYVYVDWAYNDGTTIREIWYLEQTLNAGDRIPLYAPKSHLNPWASLATPPIRGWGWYDYTPGTGRCTYNKFIVTSRWDSSYRAVYGTVKNTGNLSTAYVAFAAIYDSNGDIIAANWTGEGVKANDTDNFAVYFGWLELSRPVANEKAWAFQGQMGWQHVGNIFPDKTSMWPGLRNVCPSP